MAMWMRFVWLTFGLLLCCGGTGVYCLEREAFLTLANGVECHTQQLGEAWTSGSHAACSVECMVRYPETCQSILYNVDTKTCTPGAVAFAPVPRVNTSIPVANSRDLFYYSSQPVPPCNTSSGDFALYELCGTTVCLNLVFEKASFYDARANCTSMDSRLFIANSLVRFSVFWHVSLTHFNWYTWLGLTDLTTEGVFVWDHGEPLSAEQDKYIWSDGQPDNHGDEDCIIARHLRSGLGNGINDDDCWRKRYYICEPNNAYKAK
ncbi:CD209 antigen [Elysia marginata]|uniref:CD209 antigen n=1 Tax=Elysia marginata TaxID=1093978 RepID=A0AAV4JEB9_9GAST|nr:CD209 antigen [Elysia marginata]